MKNRLPLATGFFFLIFSIISCSPNAYRIKTVKNNESTSSSYVEFILPPKAKLTNEGCFNGRRKLDFNSNSKFRYQYIIIENLSANYPSCLENIENAEHFYYRKPATISLRDQYKITAKAKPIGTNNFAKYYSSSDNIDYQNGDKISIAIELDLDQLLKKESEYVKNYDQLATDILTTLVKLEKISPPSITQSIVEKVWELVPIPQETSLSRSLVTISEEKSVVLLNPKISLKIDHLLFYSDPNGANEFDGFNYYLSGQTILSFYRGQNGMIKQSAFLKLDENTTPNFLPNNSNVSNTDKLSHIQASSIDVQLSSITNKNFYGLYQNFLKRNNNKSSKGTCNDNKDDEVYGGGSIMLFSDAPDDIMNYPNGNSANVVLSNFCNGKLVYSATTTKPGCRSVITPTLTVNLNEIPQFVTLGTRIGDWLQMQTLPSKSMHLLRLYNGTLKEVKDFNYNTFLLPGDKISTK